MSDNLLVELSKQFAIDVVNLCTRITEGQKSVALSDKVLQGGASAGANLKQFAVDIVNLCAHVAENKKSNALLDQVLQSATNIGASVYEANFAATKQDFISRLQCALKECYRTDFLIGVAKDTQIITPDEHRDMLTKCSKIRNLIMSSITTVMKQQ